MIMPTVRKFMFDNVFEDPEPLEVEPTPNPEEIMSEETEPEEKIPTFSEEDLKAARNEGFENGKEEGLNASLDSIERQVSAALGNLEKAISGLVDEQVNANERATHLALAVAVSIVRKMLPDLATGYAPVEIEKVIRDVLPRIMKEPRITIRIHGDIESEINSRLDNLVKSADFQGVITVLPDNDVEIGDCKLEWSCGGAERNSEALWREVDGVIARHVGEDLETPPVEGPEKEIKAAGHSSEIALENGNSPAPTTDT